MNNIKIMASLQSTKAFIAMLITVLSALVVASEGGYTSAEIFTILGAALVTFQATYWVPNAKTPPDGDLDVIEQEDGKKTFSLSLNSDPEELVTKDEVVFKVNPS